MPQQENDNVCIALSKIRSSLSYTHEKLFSHIANLQDLPSLHVPKVQPIIFLKDRINLPSFLLLLTEPCVFPSMWGQILIAISGSPTFSLPHTWTSIIHNGGTH